MGTVATAAPENCRSRQTSPAGGRPPSENTTRNYPFADLFRSPWREFYAVDKSVADLWIVSSEASTRHILGVPCIASLIRSRTDGTLSTVWAAVMRGCSKRNAGGEPGSPAQAMSDRFRRGGGCEVASGAVRPAKKSQRLASLLRKIAVVRRITVRRVRWGYSVSA